jgi:hypothetical protein
MARERLQIASQICARHAKRIISAMRRFGGPFDPEQLERLSEEDIRALDQFVYRFGKLQDALGGQLITALLETLEEPYREWSMRDRLNRLEQLRILADAQDWETSRAIRNRLTHEYPDDPERQAAILNQAWKQAPVLLELTHSIVENAATRLGWSLATIPTEPA